LILTGGRASDLGLQTSDLGLFPRGLAEV
jgi:hypothetical protein